VSKFNFIVTDNYTVLDFDHEKHVLLKIDKDMNSFFFIQNINMNLSKAQV
jgi:hypothetical protein